MISNGTWSIFIFYSINHSLFKFVIMIKFNFQLFIGFLINKNIFWDFWYKKITAPFPATIELYISVYLGTYIYVFDIIFMYVINTYGR
jgi:hypothetical protein